ncbi:hypothetical protein N7463_010957 [Penicillium fimorum]|uniref:Uncharacterized protein n=1 Tax=Penicillium fimorum TaxID=1882269 RepID=A0A9W9XLT2_9EURO|nr:hypothetical protein N7463_010957 [Penicillium fimorum]
MDVFALAELGVKLVHPEGRCLRVDHEIVDAAKPKDIPGLLTQGMLDGTVTYSSVMDNFPTVARLVAFAPDTDISLALIGRCGQQIDPCETYLLCDAIIATGSTLQANDIDVWQVIKSKGDIVVGLCQRL